MGAVCVWLRSTVCHRDEGDEGRGWQWRRAGTMRCLISGALTHTGMQWRDWCAATDEREQRKSEQEEDRINESCER